MVTTLKGQSSILKKRIRDTTRAMKKKNDDTSATEDMKRKLKALNLQLEQVEQERKDQAIMRQYKYVKFVEMKKIQRRIKQVEKVLAEKNATAEEAKEDEEEFIQLGDDDQPKKKQRIKNKKILKDMEDQEKFEAELKEEIKEDDLFGKEKEDFQRSELTALSVEELKQKLKTEQIKMAYVRHFPRDVRYISLFKLGAHDLTAEQSMQMRQLIMDRIEQAMESGELNNPKFVLHKADFGEGLVRKRIKNKEKYNKNKEKKKAMKAAKEEEEKKKQALKDAKKEKKLEKKKAKKAAAAKEETAKEETATPMEVETPKKPVESKTPQKTPKAKKEATPAKTESPAEPKEDTPKETSNKRPLEDDAAETPAKKAKLGKDKYTKNKKKNKDLTPE